MGKQERSLLVPRHFKIKAVFLQQAFSANFSERSETRCEESLLRCLQLAVTSRGFERAKHKSTLRVLCQPGALREQVSPRVGSVMIRWQLTTLPHTQAFGAFIKKIITGPNYQPHSAPQDPATEPSTAHTCGSCNN